MSLTPLLIPTSPDEAFYVQRTQLDGVVYQLTFRYNQRENTYRLDAALDAGTPVASGLKVVCNIPLFYRFMWNSSTPKGALIAVSSSPDTTPPGMGDLGPGRRVQLWYTAAADVLQMQATGAILAFLRARGGSFASGTIGPLSAIAPSVISVIQLALGLQSTPTSAAIATLADAGTIRILYAPYGVPIQIILLGVT